MNKSILRLLAALFVITALVPAGFTLAQDGDVPAAEIENDEGGAVLITGEFAYSDPTLPDFGIQPIVFLGDMSQLFVEDGFDFSTEYIDLESPQIMGQITSDLAVSPFTFEFRLPIDPGGKLHDVDNDAVEDTGVMVYNINFTFNGIGDPFIDNRELVFYSSVTSSQDFETLYQINGGTLVIYAPEADQGFPSGFGADGKLFTEDDPIVSLPQGYTIVSLDSDPFTFDRAENGIVNIVESEGAEFPDFSAMTYTEAFDALLEKMRKEYAFTEFKGLDWDALAAEYRPLMEEAEANGDAAAYQEALEQFTFEIPDGHVAIGSPYLNSRPLPDDIQGGLGMAVRELSDGRVIVNFLSEAGPAAQAGIEMQAEILEINGMPVADAISAEAGLNPPYGSDVLKRLDQIRGVVLFNVDEEVEITFQNPEAAEPTTATLTTIAETESRLFSRSAIYGTNTGDELPLEYEIMENGYGYIAIYSFSDDVLLSLALWERAIKTMIDNNVPGIILDMRANGGGSPDIGNVMLGYFVDEPVYAGTSAFYYPDLDAFELNPLYETMIMPADEDVRYHGDLAVLVAPSCFSMCEFFTYALTLNDRAQVVGFYPTGGLGGGIQQFAMPEDVFGQFTIARAVGADNEIHIEGTGVAPTIVVPVDEETLFTEGDPILDAAVAYLDEATATEVIEGGAIAIGESISGELAENQRVRYSLTIAAGDLFSIFLEDPTGGLDTYLRIYVEGVEEPVIENDDNPNGETVNSAIEELAGDTDETIIVEVGTFDDAVGGEYTLRIEDLNAGAAEEATPEATEAP